MQDAITALESALASLELARAELPDDLRAELDTIVDQARDVLRSLGDSTAERSEAASAPVAAEARQETVTGASSQAGATG